MAPRLTVKEAHLLICQCWLEGQVSGLIPTSRCLLSTVWAWRLAGALSQSLCCDAEHQRELLHESGAPIFIAAALGMPLDCPAVVARGLCVPGPMGL